MPLSPLEKSAALIRADRSSLSAESVAPEQSRAVAAAISDAEIPLPPGLDTAASLDWPGQSGFGPITLTDVHHLLEVNAARDWIWFGAHNDLTDEQRQILTEVPRWRRLNGSRFGEEFAKAVDSILAGDGHWAQEFAARLFPEHGGRAPDAVAW